MVRVFKPSRARATTEPPPVRLLIDALSDDERGIGRHQGKVVFARGALPGELIEVAHYRRQQRFSECEIKQILQSSSDRVAASCQHFHRCGGCQLQHLDPARQLEFKQQNVLNNLWRQQRLRPERVLEPVYSPPFGYRSRVRLVLDGRQQLCMREVRSDRLVPIEHCPVLVPALAELLVQLKRWLALQPPRLGMTHVELVDGQPCPAVIVRHLRPLSQQVLLELAELEPASRVYLQAEKAGELVNLEGIPAQAELTYELPEQQVTLQFGPRDFTQVNRIVNRQMVIQALDWLQPQSADAVVDLFCGIGNFTVPLAQRAGRVLGIEAARHMVVRGHHNGARNALKNLDFEALDLEKESLARRLLTFGVNKILLDPPRVGAKHACEQFAETAVERLVYVSCNPASFTRDAGVLSHTGFRLAELRVLDMFPQTAHVELMGLFKRG